MRLKSFGTVTLPELNGRDGGLGSQARSNIIALQDGGYDLDGNTVYLQPMNISRSATLTEDIDDTIDNLFGEMRKGRMLLKAEMRDNSERHTFAKMTMQMRDVSADKYNCEQPINLQWSANYPYWLDTLEDFQYFDHGELFDDSDLFDSGNHVLGVMQSFDLDKKITMNVTNNSKFPIYRVFVNFSCNEFLGETVILENKNNGSGIIWESNFVSDAQDKRFDADCLSKKAFSSYSTNEYENITTIGNAIDWLFLEPGLNVIELSLLNTTGTGNYACRIIYATHYL